MPRKPESIGEKLFGEWCEGKGGRFDFTREGQLRCNFDNGEVHYSYDASAVNNPSEFLAVKQDNGSWVESTDPGVRYDSRTGYLRGNNGDVILRVNEGRITDINKEGFSHYYGQDSMQF